jgi:hypothetical protein
MKLMTRFKCKLHAICWAMDEVLAATIFVLIS